MPWPSGGAGAFPPPWWSREALPCRSASERPGHGPGISFGMVAKGSGGTQPGITWTFITTHGLVLLAIAQNPTIRLRDIAARVGITERAVQRIIADLIDAGYISRTRQGRRNVY